MPEINIRRMPEVSVRPRGCDDPGSYRTDIGTSVQGPFLLTYLNLAEGVQTTFSSGSGSSSQVQLDTNSPLWSALYLGEGKVLSFDQSVLYSGCDPD
jgi:hypothetical protein